MKHLILVFILFCTISIFSQRKKVNIDSTYTVLKKLVISKEKVDKLIVLYRSSVKQRNANEQIIDEALAISESLFYINGIAKCYNRKGLTARYQSQFNKSIRLHKRALNYFQKTTDSLSKLKCLNNIAVSYRKLNQENTAFNYYFKALKLAEQIKSKKSIAIANNGIGNIFVNTKQYNKAIEYLKKGININVEYGNDRNQEIGLSNIGEVFILQKKYDSAYIYINKAMAISIKNNNLGGIAIKNSLLGHLNQKQKKYGKAILLYDKAIADLKKYKNKRYLNNALINKGLCLLYLKQYNKALNNINEGLIVAKNIGVAEDISFGYNALIMFYTNKNDYKKALKTHNKLIFFNDSILNIKSKQSITNSQIAYESLKKDEKIQLLANEKAANLKKSNFKFNTLLIVFFVSLFIIFGLLYLRFLNKKNTFLELDNKNNEIQNYLLQIKELQHTTKTTTYTDNDKNFNLSKREQEVLNYIANGLTNAEIATEIFLSKNTVKTHIQNIYSKLDVKNRIQALQKLKNI